MLIIDIKTCLACAGCISICPKMALFLDLEHLKVDQKLCNLCRLCVRSCPVAALSLDPGDNGQSGRAA